MTKPVRYQKGYLYRSHGSWFVQYRERPKAEDGTVTTVMRTQRLGSVADYPRQSDIEPLRIEAMQRVNAAKLRPEAAITVRQFIEQVYLPWAEAAREPSTYKGYQEICENHIIKHVGEIRLREFRTVNASLVLEQIAAENDLTRTTLQHIKSVLSGVFTLAKNKGAFDGVNPVQDAMIPERAKRPSETFAYDLATIFQILEALPLLPKAVVATASFAGLREGELKGLEWQDYRNGSIMLERSVWKAHVKRPKTPASQKPVPVIPELAAILDEYRKSTGNLTAGVMFHNGSRMRMDMDKLAQRVIRPAIEAKGIRWYGWHGFRRGIASNLFALGADEKVVQRVLRHSKVHVTKERYIKAFDPAVLAAMDKMQQALEMLKPRQAAVKQLN